MESEFVLSRASVHPTKAERLPGVIYTFRVEALFHLCGANILALASSTILAD
jgi:hypothetical protein